MRQSTLASGGFDAHPLAAPALQGGLADAPAGGQLFLVQVNDFHLGLLPNELAGVHEGAVPPASQVISLQKPISRKILILANWVSMGVLLDVLRNWV